MKNIVLGWLFFLSGIALLGFSMWKLADQKSADQKSGDPTSGDIAAKGTNAAAGPGGTVAGDPMTPELPADPVMAPPDPPPVMAPPDPPPTADASPVGPPMPAVPADAMTTEPAASLSEVLLVFDARSQHISKQVKEEITALAKGHPDASFKMEVAAGELGTPEDNEKLGKKRARAIRKVLEDAGIPERKVSYKLIVPGPADGEGEQTSRQWRKATVRVAGGGK